MIWTVDRASLHDVHFDTRQYNFVVWEMGELPKFQRNLQLRIEATIGNGPNKIKVVTL